MKYYEVTFTISPVSDDARDIVSALAGEAAFETFEETDEGVKGYVQQSLFDDDLLRQMLAAFPLPDVTVGYTVSEAEDRDWNEQWEQEGFEPILVEGGGCKEEGDLRPLILIHDGRHLPTITKHPTPNTPLEIEIDTHLAFGTGTHETTRLMCASLLDLFSPLEPSSHLVPRTSHLEEQSSHLEPRTSHLEEQSSHLVPRTSYLEEASSHLVPRTSHLEEQSSHPRTPVPPHPRILDCGTGTGILAITALKLGAREAVGYDIDEWSADNAYHNAVINRVDDRFTSLLGDASILNKVEGTFDIVTANINRNILLADMPAFVSKMAPGATLLLSGFYTEDIPLLVAKAEELGLTLVAQRSDNNWACLQFSYPRTLVPPHPRT